MLTSYSLSFVYDCSVPIPDVKVKPNDIFPEEQTRSICLKEDWSLVTSFITPNIASVHYNDNDFVSYKQGYIKRAVFISVLALWIAEVLHESFNF